MINNSDTENPQMPRTDGKHASGRHSVRDDAQTESPERKDGRNGRSFAPLLIVAVGLLCIIAGAVWNAAVRVTENSKRGNTAVGAVAGEDRVTVNGATVSVYDADGREITANISVTAGTWAPAAVDRDRDPVLLHMSCVGRRAIDYPVTVYVAHDAFSDGDSVKAYQYNGSAWTELGISSVSDGAITFRTNFLLDFAIEIVPSEDDSASGENEGSDRKDEELLTDTGRTASEDIDSTPTPTAAATQTPDTAPSPVPTDDSENSAAGTTATPVRTAAPTATPVRTAAPSATPVRTAAPTATPVRTAVPTATPVRTAAPTATPVITAAPADDAGTDTGAATGSDAGVILPASER